MESQLAIDPEPEPLVTKSTKRNEVSTPFGSLLKTTNLSPFSPRET